MFAEELPSNNLNLNFADDFCYRENECWGYASLEIKFKLAFLVRTVPAFKTWVTFPEAIPASVGVFALT